MQAGEGSASGRGNRKPHGPRLGPVETPFCWRSRQGRGSKRAPWYPMEVSAVRISEGCEGRKQSGKGLVGTDQEICAPGLLSKVLNRARADQGGMVLAEGPDTQSGQKPRSGNEPGFVGKAGCWCGWNG